MSGAKSKVVFWSITALSGVLAMASALLGMGRSSTTLPSRRFSFSPQAGCPSQACTLEGKAPNYYWICSGAIVEHEWCENHLTYCTMHICS